MRHPIQQHPPMKYARTICPDVPTTRNRRNVCTAPHMPSSIPDQHGHIHHTQDGVPFHPGAVSNPRNGRNYNNDSAVPHGVFIPEYMPATHGNAPHQHGNSEQPFRPAGQVERLIGDVIALEDTLLEMREEDVQHIVEEPLRNGDVDTHATNSVETDSEDTLGEILHPPNNASPESILDIRIDVPGTIHPEIQPFTVGPVNIDCQRAGSRLTNTPKAGGTACTQIRFTGDGAGAAELVPRVHPPGYTREEPMLHTHTTSSEGEATTPENGFVQRDTAPCLRMGDPGEVWTDLEYARLRWWVMEGFTVGDIEREFPERCFEEVSSMMGYLFPGVMPRAWDAQEVLKLVHVVGTVVDWRCVAGFMNKPVREVKRFFYRVCGADGGLCLV